MCPALSLLSFFQFTTLSLLTGWLVNSPVSPSARLNHFHFISPNILSLLQENSANALQEFLSLSFYEGGLLRTNTVQTRLPSVLSPFETLCSLNTLRLKRMPSAFLLSHTVTRAHSHTPTVNTQIERNLCTNTQANAHTHLVDHISAVSFVWSVDFSSTVKRHFMALLILSGCNLMHVFTSAAGHSPVKV